MEIVTNRRKHFRENLDTNDKEIEQFLDKKTMP